MLRLHSRRKYIIIFIEFERNRISFDDLCVDPEWPAVCLWGMAFLQISYLAYLHDRNGGSFWDYLFSYHAINSKSCSLSFRSECMCLWWSISALYWSSGCIFEGTWRTQTDSYSSYHLHQYSLYLQYFGPLCDKDYQCLGESHLLGFKDSLNLGHRVDYYRNYRPNTGKL